MEPSEAVIQPPSKWLGIDHDHMCIIDKVDENLTDIQREEVIGETCFLCNADDKEKETEALKQCIEEKDKEIENLKKENLKLNSIVQSVSKIFNEDQIKRLQNPGSRSQWSDKTIQDSIGKSDF